jgi:hypothetical protein
MRHGIGLDLGTAIEKLCRRVLFDIGCRNDQAMSIGGGADIVDFGQVQACTEILTQPIIRCAKRNRFDNFTGDSLSHLITPTMIIVSESRVKIKENPAGRAADESDILF